MSSFTKDVLYDLPVSNHGGRVRFLIYAKGLKEQVPVVSPIEAFGGIKTAEYLAVSPQGKMPALLADDGRFPLCESDTICRYIMQKYNDVGPSFYPSHPMQLALSEQLTRLLDIYVGSIQGCVYKAPGSVFGSFGTDRKAAFAELKKQLLGMEQLLDKFASTYPDLTGIHDCSYSD